MPRAKRGGTGPFVFEEAMARLEQMVKDLESGKLTLEQSLAAFEEGVVVVKECRAYLESAKQRVEVLLGEDEDGRPVIESYEEDVEDEDDEEAEDE